MQESTAGRYNSSRTCNPSLTNPLELLKKSRTLQHPSARYHSNTSINMNLTPELLMQLMAARMAGAGGWVQQLAPCAVVSTAAVVLLSMLTTPRIPQSAFWVYAFRMQQEQQPLAGVLGMEGRAPFPSSSCTAENLHSLGGFKVNCSVWIFLYCTLQEAAAAAATP